MKGFTTVEILVAALFGMIVMAALYGFFRDQLFHLIAQEVKTATLEDARGGLDLMARELRNAGAFPVAIPSTDTTCAKDGSGNPKKIVAASASYIQIQSDTEGNGNCSDTGENVTYTYVSTANSSTDPCPGKRITRNGFCLVANVVIPSGSEFLTYYQAGSTTALTHPISDLTTIKRIKITFSVQLTNPNPYTRSANPHISSTLSSSVEFRN